MVLRSLRIISYKLVPFSPSGDQRYSEVEYSGVLSVNSKKGEDYIGMIFGYQNNKKFFAVVWRRENTNLGNTTVTATGIKGVQLKV